MNKVSKLLLRLMLALAVMAVVALDVDSAVAQSRNCAALENTLRSIERSGDYRNLQSINDRARGAQSDVQQAESRYVRDGCNAAAKRGEQLSSQCRAEARAVLRARDTYAKISRQADTGNAVAQQREAVLQEMARFNCDSRLRANVRERDRGNIFDRIFGNVDSLFGDEGDGVDTRGDEFSGYAGYETVRTVCVRKSDGYYWPVSYSTLVDYAPNDLLQCQTQCPNQDVDLYYYDNPGQEPQQMVNLQGVAYTSLPSAFAYRKAYDPANSCKAAVTYGSIALAADGDGSSRPVIDYAGESFPLPLRDPRRAQQVTVLPVANAQLVDVPLPRPRPAAPGEEPKPVAVRQAANQRERIVMFGDKRVRIVGPTTPYAPAAAAGT